VEDDAARCDNKQSMHLSGCLVEDEVARWWRMVWRIED
jgi:hypothetical protein